MPKRIAQAYATKMVCEEKRHLKLLEHKLDDSGESEHMTKSTKKLLISLIQTLNASLLGDSQFRLSAGTS